MTSRRVFHSILTFVLAVALACSPAEALVSLNDGHDHIYVTGSVGFAWDSNVFANSNGRADYSKTASIVAEYARRAGWIGVNASVELDAARYNNLKDENFNNPKFSAELTKQTGRTTGSLTLTASRESRADAAVNMRTTTWNYGSGLNFRYPIVTIYTLSGQLGYSEVKYMGNVFPTLSTYTASADLIRIFSSERDVMLGYRYRRGQTSIHTNFVDQAMTVGMTGKLIRGLNGTLRAGYQIRTPHDLTGQDKSTGSWTASGSATYPINKRFNLTGTIAKDFATTANDSSVDSLTASVDAQYAFSSHWTFSADVSAGDSKFIGAGARALITAGPPPVFGPERRDQFLTSGLSINYSLNEHLKIAATYAWFKNWSNTAFAAFVRNSYNLNISSRW